MAILRNKLGLFRAARYAGLAGFVVVARVWTSGKLRTPVWIVIPRCQIPWE